MLEGLNGPALGRPCIPLTALLVTPPNTRHSTRVTTMPRDCGGLTVHPVIRGTTGAQLG